MNRRGELSFKGGLRDAQQVAEFRSKMLDSGAFSTVIVEEQTPTPDQQKLNVRISAQWNPNFQPANAARSKSDSPAAKANKPNPEVAFHD